MRIQPLHQSNYNSNQSFQGVKFPLKPIVACNTSKGSTQTSNLSFWQKVKAAWNLVNKLQ